jgi:Flp pilus assembly protein TadD
MRTRPVQLLAALTIVACAAPSREVVAQRALGQEFVRRGEWQAAFEIAQRLCTEHPEDPYGPMLRGLVYTEQGLLAEAEADLKASVRLDPRLARAHAALGVLHDVQGRPDDALEHHRRAVELAPREPAYLNNLGFSLFVNGRAREAIPVLHETLRAAPMDTRVRNNLGFAYAAVGDLPHAAEQFALAGDPAQAKNNLGWAYERRGSLPQAFDLYVEALRIAPASDAARHNLTRVAKALGREIPPDVGAATPRS